MVMKKAVHFGAGSIGMGLFGQMYYESGFETVFVDQHPELVRLINEYKSYPLEIIGAGGESKEIVIKNIRAISIFDSNLLAEEIAHADVLSTAVGASNLSAIAEPIACGLRHRWCHGNLSPVDIILGENMVDTDQRLRELIEAEMPSETLRCRLQNSVGLVDASVERLGPMVERQPAGKHPLSRRVSDRSDLRLPVDRDALKGITPDLLYIDPVSDFAFTKKVKIFVFNSGHSILAYLGNIKGYTHMSECRKDPTLIDIVYWSMMEAGRAVCMEYDKPFVDLEKRISESIISMGKQAPLDDAVLRVARQPLRKLSDNERLMGGAKLAVKNGILPLNLCLATAAVIHYYNPSDECSVRMRDMVECGGPQKVLKEVCNIDEGNPMFPATLCFYGLLAKGLLMG
jgi:mannitol-1-phosphate 5-dehydrogenase